jgi:hypothetical protein
MRARLRMTEPLVPATVMLPYVSGWRDLADPWTAAARWQQDPRVPRPMRAFVAALQRLAAAVTPLLRPLAAPVPSAAPSLATEQTLAPAAVRPGVGRAAPMSATAGRPVVSPAAAAVIAARGVTGPATSATGRSARHAMPTPVGRSGAPVPVRPVVQNPTRGR